MCILDQHIRLTIVDWGQATRGRGWQSPFQTFTIICGRPGVMISPPIIITFNFNGLVLDIGTRQQRLYYVKHSWKIPFSWDLQTRPKIRMQVCCFFLFASAKAVSKTSHTYPLSLHYLFSKCVDSLSLFYDPHVCLVLKLFYYNNDLLMHIHPSWLAHLYIYTYFMTSALCFLSMCARVWMDFLNYWREIIEKFITDWSEAASSNFRTVSLVMYI